MKKRNEGLALILIVGLVLVSGLTLLLDVGNSSGMSAADGSCSVLFSEVCGKNETILADSDGKYRDYIELFNAGEAADLTGFTLTDGQGTSDPLDGVILEAGEYRVFFLGDDVTCFGIGASGGDCIQLRDSAGNIVAQVNTAALGQDEVMLWSDGLYRVSDQPSPGFENSDQGVEAFLYGLETAEPLLTVSEVLIANTAALADENGAFSDVVELRNCSDAPLYLGNYFLSDNLGNRFRFRLPDQVLGAGEYLVIYCDGQNYLGPKGEIHASFGLTSGETVVLTDRFGGYTTMTAEYAGDDVSVFAGEDGSVQTGTSSLGYPNDEAGMAAFFQSRIDGASPLVISEVLLSSAGVPYEGAFRDVVEIYNRSDAAVSTAGWYLSDGGDPYAYALPETVLQSREILVIPCGPAETGFGLSEGENVRLLGPEFRYAPVVTCVAPETGMSISLNGDYADPVYGFAGVTLGYPNYEENQARFLEDQMPGALMISEVMSANQSYLPGSYKTTADWIEVYNGSGETVRLSDYCITDETGNIGKYALPDETLEPGEYRVLLLSKDPTNLPRGYSVLPFSISSEGEQLYLSRDGQIVDYALIPNLPTDMSYGRAPGSGAMSLLAEPTPERENRKAVEQSAMPAAVTAQGTYDGVEYLDVELSGQGEIYYTTNCREPGSRSKRYTGPIRITETTVIRAVCREEGKLESEVLSLTYVVNENDTLPVVTIVMNPDDLWSDEDGIYVPGPNMEPDPPHYGANFWMDWEKKGTLSLFETNGEGFSVNCGIRIFGAFTRVLPKKSLACMFRDYYGDGELAYPLFGEGSLDTYESIILRTGGQDAFKARMRDVMITSLVSDATDMPVQQYKPVVVYLNGQYWGLHYIREKLNENYVAGHYNVSPDSVTLLEQGGWKSHAYRDLISYTLQNDMREQEHYDYVCSQINVDNYIDYYIAQMWVANTDNGNVKFFRIDDGPWTWCLFDTDLSFTKYSLNTVKNGLTTANLDASNYTAKTFAARMLYNDDFREKFLTRMAWQMNNIWTEENVIARIDELEAAIAEDMVKDCKRWDYSYKAWQNNVEQLRNFARERNGYMLSYIRSYFGLTDAEMRRYGFDV